MTKSEFLTTCIVVALAATMAAVPCAQASTPEYMRMNPRPGMTLEIKGKMAGESFEALDIEEIDGPRKPKLRAPISSVDRNAKTIVVLGMHIAVSDTKTRFDRGGFDDLKVGHYVEVKSSVYNDGTWHASSIKTHAVKRNIKVKVTVTRAAVDGESPDSIEASGFVIVLTTKTDLNEALIRPKRIERDRFGELAWIDARGLNGGVRSGDERFLVTGEYRQNVQTRSEFDLTNQFSSDQEDTQPELRLKAYAFASDNVRAKAVLRGRKQFVLNSDLGTLSPDLQLHFTELSVLIRDLGGSPVALRVGRQDIDEPREWLYDEYVDALRVQFYPTKKFELEAALFRAVSPIKNKLDTWTDIHGVVRWRPKRRNTLSAYFLARSDSDALRNREPRYFGLRYYGDVVRALRAWGELSFMRGSDKGLSLSGWALDVGGTLRARETRFQPSVTAGLAIGSGGADKANGKDSRFRQTGYEDNAARLGGVTQVYYYGSVLYPELSNLVISTIGGGFHPIEDGSVEVFYHAYRQHTADDKIRGELFDPPARPNGVDDDIGWGLDLVVGLPRLWNGVRVSWTAGLFEPGGAFTPRQNRAVYNKVDLRFVF